MNLDEIRHFFQADVFAAKAGILIDSATEEEACCHMLITPDHFNASHVVQGGAVFTLADFTFAVAANANGQMTVSLNNSITFHRPAKGQALYAKASLLSASKRVASYQVIITDDLGNLVASMSANGFRKEKSS